MKIYDMKEIAKQAGDNKAVSKAARKAKLERTKAAQGLNRSSSSCQVSKRNRVFENKKIKERYGSGWKKESREYV